MWLYDHHILIDTSDCFIKFNFPGMGEELVAIFRCILTALPNVQQLACTNPTVMRLCF